MVWWTALLPLVAGGAIWAGQPLRLLPAAGRPGGRGRRWVLGTMGTAALLATLGLALWAARNRPTATVSWGGGLALHAGIDPVAGTVAVLAPAVAVPIVVYAAAHEDRRGLARLVGLLVAFVGAMELVVIAADLLTLLLGWELVGWASWALIGHAWWEADKPAAAAQAFNTTRFGDLGLFLAAGAAFAATGSLRYADLGDVTGSLQHVMVFGIVLAAVAKSAQVPFAPWLLSAMAGPTSVSALLHAATMVAAGAYLLARLHPTLRLVGWFGPSLLAVGLGTAILGGVVASVQPHAKKLLAASTSAHHGLMLVAIGAGSASIGVAHLVAHAAFKAALFLVAGIAAAAVGSEQLGRMRLGRS
ncbi:MAG TPA: proton-conducting transporter membrane subunit [Egibacteraceae bacterium]|nr:proton-conducting transporter membrane subunit [Egibacteraceae bacterium]